MRNKLLVEAFEEISHDTKFIRLATITTFVHSLFFLLYIVYRASTVVSKAQWWTNEFTQFIIDVFSRWDINIRILVLIGIPLLIGYSILPPVGEGAMIYYLNNPRKQWTASLGKWFGKFLQMFEFDAAITFFNIVIFLAAVSRIYVMDISTNIFIIIIMSIWFIVIVVAEFLLPYTRFFITLENKGFFQAMKASAQTSIEHMGVTCRYILVDVVLHLRLIVNIILIFGIPLALLYLASWIGIADVGLVKWIIIICIIILFLLTAYINGIIEAFFTTYRYKVYKKIQAEEAADEAAITNTWTPADLARIEDTKEKKAPQQVIINQYIVQPGTQATNTQKNTRQVIYPNSEDMPELPDEVKKYLEKQGKVSPPE